MFTLSSSSLISDGDGGSHMETVRVITHTIGRGVQKIQAVKSAKCSMLYQPLDHCSWNSNITQGTQSLCLDWTPSPLSPSPQCHYVNTPMLTFFRPLTPIPLSFVSCLIFGICGNVGNQTRVAAAAAEGGSRYAGTRGGEAAQSCLVMSDRADTDWVSKIMMFVVRGLGEYK